MRGGTALWDFGHCTLLRRRAAPRRELTRADACGRDSILALACLFLAAEAAGTRELLSTPAAPPSLACADVAHRWTAAPLDPVTGLYRDSGSAASGSPAATWWAAPLAAPASGGPVSLNDYGLTHPLVSGDAFVGSGELYSPGAAAWQLNGQQGWAAVLPSSSNATLGAASGGLTVSIRFLVDRTWSAVNEGRNVLFAATTADGRSLRVVFTAGLRGRPRLSVRVSRLSAGGATSSTSSDYASSESDFAPGTPNGGTSAYWLHTLGGAWQQATLAFDGATGALTALVWNGKPQSVDFTPCVLGPLPFGPLSNVSAGFDAGVQGLHKGSSGRPWRTMEGLQVRKGVGGMRPQLLGQAARNAAPSWGGADFSQNYSEHR
jgi:hypothetical protein